MLSSSTPVCHEFFPTVPDETLVYLACAKGDLYSGEALPSSLFQLLVVGLEIAFSATVTAWGGYNFGIFPLT